jgi:glyoxylate reductase
VTRRVPEAVDVELRRLFELELHDSERPPGRAELLAGSRGADGLVTMLNDRVDGELLAAAGPQLRVVANYAVGYDNVALAAATRRGIVVTNTPDVLTEATAELTLTLILTLVRRVAEGDRLVRRREPWLWAPTFMLGEGLAGKTLGCVGFGRIGRAVARLAGALGMRVVYTNRNGPVDRDGDEAWMPLEQLLREADVVTLHVPLTPATHHLIDEAALAGMRRGAYLVNTSRGPVVDESALAAALAAGAIAGAALDVFEHEPEVDPKLLGLENVVVAPHLGSATRAAREAMGMLCVEALRAVLVDGRLPANAVNPEAWPG